MVEEYVNLGYHGKRANTPDFMVTINRDYDDSIPEVEVVQEEIGRVILNIVNNAFYAVHERAHQGEEGYTPMMTVGTRQQGNRVEIWVQDNGTGIPEEVREKIFEPFFTTKPAGAGTGLGLSLSHEIVTKGHSGTLSVESEEGTRFVVGLPLV